jgi:RNA polymerase sigma factor (TIGR02999 family)
MPSEDLPEGSPPPTNVTRLLNRLAQGAPADHDGLAGTVYQELRSIAARHMAGERRSHTLQATALVNEAYMRLVGDPALEWESRRHFYAAAAEAMRRVLVDHARKRGGLKRGGGWRGLSLEGVDIAKEEDFDGILALNEALVRLEGVDARAAEVVRLRFYAGLDIDQTAQVAGRSRRTVLRDWTFAKAWLADALGESDERPRKDHDE